MLARARISQSQGRRAARWAALRGLPSALSRASELRSQFKSTSQWHALRDGAEAASFADRRSICPIGTCRIPLSDPGFSNSGGPSGQLMRHRLGLALAFFSSDQQAKATKAANAVNAGTFANPRSAKLLRGIPVAFPVEETQVFDLQRRLPRLRTKKRPSTPPPAEWTVLQPPAAPLLLPGSLHPGSCKAKFSGQQKQKPPSRGSCKPDG